MVEQVRFVVRLRGPLCVSSGRPRAGADAGVARAPDGTPIVPATTLKGAARDALVNATDGSWAALVDEAFGTSGEAEQADRSGAVRFSDAVPADAHEVETQLITTVALSPQRTAQPGRLTTVEVVAPRPRHAAGPVEVLALHGQLSAAPARRESPETLLAVAVCGLASVRHLGARTRRGWGAVEVALGPETRGLQQVAAQMIGAAS